MTATATETETVIFNSKSPNQILTRRPERHVPDGFGGRIPLTESEWFAQQEEKGEPFDDAPWKVEFKDHVYKAKHPTIIEWLRKHDKLGSSGPSGFYEADPLPEDLKPTQIEQFKAIAKAQDDSDWDQIVAIQEQERQTHNRPVVIEAAEAAKSVLAEEPSKSEAVAGSPGDPPSTSTP